VKLGPTGCPETSVTIKKRCVTSQKSEGLVYTAAEAANRVSIRLKQNKTKVSHVRRINYCLTAEDLLKNALQLLWASL
jgi:hypothetical protein